jgi:hypothetical protein
MSQPVTYARFVGPSIALCAALARALGAATGHMGVWVASGVAAGIAIALVGRGCIKSPHEEGPKTNS